MAMTTRIDILLLALAIPLLFHCCNSDEVEKEEEFSYLEGSSNGPKHWGHIHPEWRACRDGKSQSPVDLLGRGVTIAPHLRRLEREYKPTIAVLVNRGHDIMLKWEGDAGGILINGTEYYLNQLHWHTPSEHQIHEKRFSMELHMVHKSRKDGYAVVGILYKQGRPDSLLTKLMHNITLVEETELNVGIIDPREIKFGSRKYYRYTGSLTTPPCTEGVIWTIIKKVRTVSREQIRALRQAVHDGFEANARPIQSIHDRAIFMYRPHPQGVKLN